MRALTKAMLFMVACYGCLADGKTSDSPASQPLTGRASASAPQFAPARRKPSNHLDRLLETDRVRNLIGMRVENEDGQDVGNLEDFLVDLRSGQLIYALVSSGGFLGLHKQFRIIPPAVLSAATAKRGVLELNVGNFRWQHAPRFSYGALSSVANLDQERHIYHYYNRVPSAALADSTVYAVTNPHPSPQRSGLGVREGIHGGKRSLKFVSQILGKPLINQNKEFIGSIADLLVDLKGLKPVLVLVSPDGMLPEGSFAVVAWILYPQGSDSFTIKASRKLFAQAPALDQQAWLAVHDSAAVIFRSQHAANPNSRRERHLQGDFVRRF